MTSTNMITELFTFVFSYSAEKVLDRIIFTTTLKSKIEEAYQKALQKWSKNDIIRDSFKSKQLSRLDDFRQYILTGKNIPDNELKSLFIEFEDAKQNGNYHVFVAEVDGQTKYIFPVYGAGLWGAIWGYVTLNEDKDTVFGTYFSHASETPGLGAEIATEWFQNSFIGKKVLNAGKVALSVVKNGNAKGDANLVDGVSGGTMTSNGVDAMLRDCLSNYQVFLNK